MKDIKFPYAVQTDGTVSVTLMFAYVSFLIACVANGYLLYKDATAGTVSSLMMFFGTLLFYRMNKIDKFSFDLQNRKFEVDSEDEEKK